MTIINRFFSINTIGRSMGRAFYVERYIVLYPSSDSTIVIKLRYVDVLAGDWSSPCGGSCSQCTVSIQQGCHGTE